MPDALATLVDAVSRGDLRSAHAVLDANPDLARMPQGGATPMHYAAVHGQRDAVDLLIDQGASLEALDQEYGAAPIGWANEKGHMELVRHMRARGARVSLHTASAFGFLDDVKTLAGLYPHHINHLVGYGAPLHLAALWGHPEVVSHLLSAGADPAKRNQDGELAYTIARRQSLSDACQTPIVTADRRSEIVEGCRRAAEILKAVTIEPI